MLIISRLWIYIFGVDENYYDQDILMKMIILLMMVMELPSPLHEVGGVKMVSRCCCDCCKVSGVGLLVVIRFKFSSKRNQPLGIRSHPCHPSWEQSSLFSHIFHRFNFSSKFCRNTFFLELSICKVMIVLWFSEDSCVGTVQSLFFVKKYCYCWLSLHFSLITKYFFN